MKLDVCNDFRIRKHRMSLIQERDRFFKHNECVFDSMFDFVIGLNRRKILGGKQID